MFKNKLKVFGVIVFLGITIVACEKEIKYIAQKISPANKAYIKIVHAAPSFRNVFNTRDTFHVYANGDKINATFLTYTSAFPSATGNGYLAIDPGDLTLKLFTPGVLVGDSVEVATFSKTVEAGNYYSFIITDSVKLSRDSSQIWLRDNFETPPQNLYGLRFVHAAMNDTVGKRVDVFSARRNGNIFSNYAPGQASSFTNFPFNSQIPDTIIVRRSGTTMELARINNITFGHTRVYTLVFRGNVAVTGTKGKALTYYVNK